MTHGLNVCFYSLFLLFLFSYYCAKNHSAVELYPGTMCHVLFYFFKLFISGSPSPSISVCHVSSAGSRGGRLLLHAWVWEEDSTPLPFAQTHMNDSPRFVFVWKTLTQWHKFVPDSKLRGGVDPFQPTAKNSQCVRLGRQLRAWARARRWSS